MSQKPTHGLQALFLQDCLDPRHCHSSEMMGLVMARVPPYRASLTLAMCEVVREQHLPQLTVGGKERHLGFLFWKASVVAWEMEQGILLLTSCGLSGHGYGNISSLKPWMVGLVAWSRGSGTDRNGRLRGGPVGDWEPALTH